MLTSLLGLTSFVFFVYLASNVKLRTLPRPTRTTTTTHTKMASFGSWEAELRHYLDDEAFESQVRALQMILANPELDLDTIDAEMRLRIKDLFAGPLGPDNCYWIDGGVTFDRIYGDVSSEEEELTEEEEESSDEDESTNEDDTSDEEPHNPPVIPKACPATLLKTPAGKISLALAQT